MLESIPPSSDEHPLILWKELKPMTFGDIAMHNDINRDLTLGLQLEAKNTGNLKDY